MCAGALDNPQHPLCPDTGPPCAAPFALALQSTTTTVAINAPSARHTASTTPDTHCDGGKRKDGDGQEGIRTSSQVRKTTPHSGPGGHHGTQVRTAEPALSGGTGSGWCTRPAHASPSRGLHPSVSTPGCTRTVPKAKHSVEVRKAPGTKHKKPRGNRQLLLATLAVCRPFDWRCSTANRHRKPSVGRQRPSVTGQPSGAQRQALDYRQPALSTPRMSSANTKKWNLPRCRRCPRTATAAGRGQPPGHVP
mmetsp:Transcript_71337/g.119413  ORF Transcript_71337/g.119413 Transcript_71337/m.119413 type:complete len:250 (+) Transcript_71337:1075-1824(+)